MEKQPPTTWNLANAHEYGFYSNVNPGGRPSALEPGKGAPAAAMGMRPTLKFNGYEDQVASLYTGMDLKKYY